MIDAEIRREIVDLQSGRLINTGEFTLAVSPAVSTTIIARLCNTTSAVLPIPLDVGAAYEMSLGEFYIEPAKGEFTVFHTAAGTVRTFRFSVFTNIVRT